MIKKKKKKKKTKEKKTKKKKKKKKKEKKKKEEKNTKRTRLSEDSRKRPFSSLSFGNPGIADQFSRPVRLAAFIGKKQKLLSRRGGRVDQSSIVLSGEEK
jgi:hypothetical protein